MTAPSYNIVSFVNVVVIIEAVKRQILGTRLWAHIPFSPKDYVYIFHESKNTELIIR